MRGLIYIVFIITFLVTPRVLLAQEEEEYDHEDHAHHHHKRNEVGAAVGMVFDLNEQDFATGLHLHYIRMFGGKLNHFGVDPGIGVLLGEHKHYTLHLMITYRPLYGWWLSVGPGITYFANDEEWAASGHIETGYEFDAGKIHFGPVIEYAWAQGDQHIMLGLHLGIPF